MKNRIEENNRMKGSLSIDSKLKGLFLHFGGYEMLSKVTNIEIGRIQEITKTREWTKDEEEIINDLYYQVFDFG